MNARTLLSLTAPVAMGYIPLSMAFGFLVVQSGFSPWLALGMSVIVYTGTLQFLAVPMLAAGLSAGEIAFVGLATNIRHVFYGLALRPHMPKGRLARLYAIYALTDETFSIVTASKQPVPPGAIPAIAGINQSFWILGTAIGAFLGESLPALDGLGFALTALFVVLAIDQARLIRRAFPFVAALAASAIALAVAAQNMLFVAIGLTLMAIIAAASRTDRQEPQS
jgi:4-azaleucine resistance transporter AzlC